MSTLIARTEEANIGLLQYQTEQEMFKQLFYTRWMAYVKKDPITEKDVPPVAPIVVKRDFAANGMDSLKVPMLRNLTGVATYGDRQLVGNTEAQRLMYANAYINARSHGVAPPAVMANQRVKRLELVAQAQPQLTDWLARDTEIQIARAVYEGWSENVTAATLSGGYAITKRQHPNIFTPDAGRVTWSGTTATYAASIHSAISGWSAQSNQIMSARALHEFRIACQKAEIQPIRMEGLEFRVLLIHPNQERQLFLDQEFRETMQHADVRDMRKNTLFSGLVNYFAGFCIFSREFSVFGVSTTASTTTWGATNPKSAVDTYNVKGAVCFGNNFLGMGWADGPTYEVEYNNFKRQKETAVLMLDGFMRNDFYDSSSSPTDVVNKSSAILLTDSPDSWN